MQLHHPTSLRAGWQKGASAKLTKTAPTARYFGAMLALMIVISGAVRAEPVFSFDATPGKLPKAVVPINYAIEPRPDAESLLLPGVE
jgi:hypothetical protein